MATTNFDIVAADSFVVGGVTLVPGWTVTKKAGAAFAGATGDAHGDSAGTGNPATLFTVTGVIECRIFGVCNVNLTGAGGTLEVGVAGNTAALIAQSTGTDIDAGEIWRDATPALGAEALGADSFMVLLNIIETVGTADITAGQIDYYCIWRPISSGATVVAA